MYAIFKRTFDFTVALFLLLMLAPLAAVLAVVIRLALGAPVIFRHARPGYRECTFYCLKFRTMTDARDASGELLPDEQRLTPLGLFLRRSSLDEIPQLWNVLRGDMSLVGPRPLLHRYLPRYTAEQRRRHLVPPGITGWAQVNGRNALDWDRKFAMDVWYVDHRGFLLDLKILGLTAWKVLHQDGISQPGHTTSSEFLGTEACAGRVAEHA
jgi:sugar transferase EpsL